MNLLKWIQDNIILSMIITFFVIIFLTSGDKAGMMFKDGLGVVPTALIGAGTVGTVAGGTSMKKSSTVMIPVAVILGALVIWFMGPEIVKLVFANLAATILLIVIIVMFKKK